VGHIAAFEAGSALVFIPDGYSDIWLGINEITRMA
jgi:hypothetical protein